MARRTRAHLNSSSPLAPPDLSPRHLTNLEFGRRLHNLMLRKGWNQSDLARRSDLERDHISRYVRGKSFPEPQNLQKLADALGVQPGDLLPNYVEQAIDTDPPSIEIKVSPGAPMVAWLRINRMVSLSAATKIAEILEHDNPVLDRT